VILSALLLGLTPTVFFQEPATVPKLPPSTFPADEESFAEALGIDKVQRLTLPGMELWCDNPKIFKALAKQIPKSYSWAVEALGILDLPEGVTLRLILLENGDSVRALYPLVTREAARWKLQGPPLGFFDGVAKSGSGLCTFPAFGIVHTKILRDPKREPISRAVHDMASLMVDFAASGFGFGVPEFLEEGFAGMVLRRTVDKPVPLV
jgi:hypothetical protein